MIIRLNEVSAAGTEYRGEEPAEIIDVGPEQGIRLLSPIACNLRAVRIPGTLLVTGTLSARAEFHCARCDDAFEGVLDEPQFERAWELSPDGLQWIGRMDDDPDEAAENRAHSGLPAGTAGGGESHDSVDLTEDIREAMILRFPGHPVCSPDCKGLCASCGVNLNKAACRCARPQDNRWAMLDRWDAQ